MESVDHLFVNCYFTIRLWSPIKDWLGLHSVDLTRLANPLHPYLVGHHDEAQGFGLPHPSCVVENLERKKHQEQARSTPDILEKVKRESKLWVLAGAKRTGNLMPRESFCNMVILLSSKTFN
jgi:hypothetical protein